MQTIDLTLDTLPQVCHSLSEKQLCEFAAQADTYAIVKEVFHAQHESTHKMAFEKKVQQHHSKYPGGTLPTELRSFERHVSYMETILDIKKHRKCLSCGSCY